MGSIAKPTVHLNGTGAETLMRQFEKAGQALRAALQALRDAAPNGRDYYPQGPNALRKAQEDHEARLQRLDAVLREIKELYEHVLDSL